MGLHQNARFFLVGLAQILAGLDGFGEARIEICGLRNARAVRALAAEIRNAIGRRCGSRQFIALASISASVYLPAPVGPARIIACGK